MRPDAWGRTRNALTTEVAAAIVRFDQAANAEDLGPYRSQGNGEDVIHRRRKVDHELVTIVE